MKRFVSFNFVFACMLATIGSANTDALFRLKTASGYVDLQLESVVKVDAEYYVDITGTVDIDKSYTDAKDIQQVFSPFRTDWVREGIAPACVLNGWLTLHYHVAEGAPVQTKTLTILCGGALYDPELVVIYYADTDLTRDWLASN